MKAGVIGSGIAGQVPCSGSLRHGHNESVMERLPRQFPVARFVKAFRGAEAARAIEPLCILGRIPGFTRNQWTHAF